MGKGTAKSATAHTIPVITVKQISSQYGIAGQEYKQVRGKLVILGYIKPIRPGSFTYELLQGFIPPTLSHLDYEYMLQVYGYDLPKDYQVIRDKIEALMEDVGELCQRNWDGKLGELHNTAHDLLKQAYTTLPEHILPSDLTHSFICPPIHDEHLNPATSRQHKLENLVNLLRVIHQELKNLYQDYGMLEQGFIPIMLYDLQQATEILSKVVIPTIFKERQIKP